MECYFNLECTVEKMNYTKPVFHGYYFLGVCVGKEMFSSVSWFELIKEINEFHQSEGVCVSCKIVMKGEGVLLSLTSNPVLPLQSLSGLLSRKRTFVNCQRVERPEFCLGPLS